MPQLSKFIFVFLVNFAIVELFQSVHIGHFGIFAHIFVRCKCVAKQIIFSDFPDHNKPQNKI